MSDDAEMYDSDEHSSLLLIRVNYSKEKLYYIVVAQQHSGRQLTRDSKI